MKKIISLFVAVVSVFTLLPQLAFAGFPDVTDAYHKEAVNWLQDNGIVQGYSDGTFKPTKSVTRAEFLKMLYETIGMKGATVKLPFTDIDSNAWYIKYLKEAYANHVIDGYSDGTFKPDNTINVAEAFKIIANAFFDVSALYNDGKNLHFCDGSQFSYNSNEWYVKYLGVIDSLCLTPLDAARTDGFHPELDMTRGGMAVMIYRAKASHDNGDVKFTAGLTPKSKTEQKPATPQETAVNIQNFSFAPSSLTIKKGTKVTWTNNDNSTHTVTVDSGTGPSSNNLSSGDTYSYTFNDAGTFAYHCKIHTMMKGTVIVTE